MAGITSDSLRRCFYTLGTRKNLYEGINGEVARKVSVRDPKYASIFNRYLYSIPIFYIIL